MTDYIDREDAIAETRKPRFTDAELRRRLSSIPTADVVPWEWMERYADYFCAGVSMPEFVREAKMFYESTNKAMQGGVIDG